MMETIARTLVILGNSPELICIPKTPFKAPQRVRSRNRTSYSFVNYFIVFVKQPRIKELSQEHGDEKWEVVSRVFRTFEEEWVWLVKERA
jgi:hypothetical protein